MATATTKEKVWQRKEREATEAQQRADALATAAVAARKAAMPKVGDRVRVTRHHNPLSMEPIITGKEGIVTHSIAPTFEVILDFDQWEHCDSCGQKTRKKWTRLRDTDVEIVR